MAGLEVRDVLLLVLPLAGVIIGALLTRSTHFTLEDTRAAREEARETRREARELETERREAKGIARVLAEALKDSQARLQMALRYGWRPEGAPLAADLRPDDAHRLAAWLDDDDWEMLALTQKALRHVDDIRRSGPDRDPDEDERIEIQGSLDDIPEAVRILREAFAHEVQDGGR